MTTKLIIPTSINMLTLANETILRNYRRGQAAELTLPSLRRRAKMIVAEEGMVAVTEEEVQTPLLLTR